MKRTQYYAQQRQDLVHVQVKVSCSLIHRSPIDHWRIKAQSTLGWSHLQHAQTCTSPSSLKIPQKWVNHCEFFTYVLATDRRKSTRNATQDGIIFNGQKCVIPMSLKLNIKEKLRLCHIKIQGSQGRAREVIGPTRTKNLRSWSQSVDLNPVTCTSQCSRKSHL